MLDPDSIGTGLVILGTAEVSKDSVQRLLAPTADYMGAGLLHGTKAAVNTVRVLVKSVQRLGTRLDSSGEIPPRVMREALDQALFCEDELTAEYLGGILASSYSGVSRDDRGLALLNTLRRLSTYAIRTHYICYRDYCRLHRGRLTLAPVFSDEGVPNRQIAEDTRVVAPKTVYSTAMGLRDDESYHDIYMHVGRSLEREELLKLGPMGDGEFLTRLLNDGIPEEDHYCIDNDAFIYNSTGAGGELFLWGLGLGRIRNVLDFVLAEDDELPNVSVMDVPEPEGFRRLADVRRAQNR